MTYTVKTFKFLDGSFVETYNLKILFAVVNPLESVFLDPFVKRVIKYFRLKLWYAFRKGIVDQY